MLGVTFTRTNCPLWLLTVLRTAFVTTSVNVIVAPGRDAPVASVTVPVMVPELVSCPKAGLMFKNTEARSMVIATVNVRKREISMWSPLKCFCIFPA